MKKLAKILISFLVTAFMLCTFCFANLTTAFAAGSWTDGLSYNASYAFGGGTGTTGDPYVISTATQLAQLAVNVNGGSSYEGKYFRLSGSIDLSGSDWVPIGNNDHRFQGYFDGNDHTVSNLTINNSLQYNGLFGYAEGAELVDIGVTSCSITSTAGYCGALAGQIEGCSVSGCYSTGTVTGLGYVGGLLGHSGIYGGAANTITNCYSQASVTATTNSHAGGFVGESYVTTITDCYATGDVNGVLHVGGFTGGQGSGSIDQCYATGDVTATQQSVGGFAGNPAGTITNCYSRGDVASLIATGYANCGGFVGINVATIKNCYSSGTVTGTGTAVRIGGFVGFAQGGSYTLCYYDSTKTPIEAKGNTSGATGEAQTGITGMSTVNMQGMDALTNASKLDLLDSDAGASVGGEPIWFAHVGKYPDFIGEKATVTFDSQSATTDANPASMDVYLGYTVSALPAEPIKTNHVFNGWWTSPNGGGTEFTDTTPVTENITVYAYWTEKEQVTVTFDSQSATTAATPASITVYSGNSVGTLPSEPVKTYYEFGGWWTAANGGGTQFTASTMVNSSITVYAKWTAQPALTSSDADGVIYTGGRITLTPNIDGGTWSYDTAYLSQSGNTFTALKTGTVVVTYTVDGVSVSYTVTVESSTLPNTGQDSTWIYILLGLAPISVIIGLLIYGPKKKRA